MDEKKILYEWGFEDIQRSEGKVVVSRGMRGKYLRIARSMLTIGPTDDNIPELSLQSTAEYFVNKLSAADSRKLQSTMRSLNGKTIKVGSTCSGTDVIIPVVKWTFHTLSRMFNVTCFPYSEYTFYVFLGSTQGTVQYNAVHSTI